MDQNKSIHSLKPLIRANKNLVYKGKKYPIDFNLIKNNSNYFYSRQDSYGNVQDIQLPEEPIDIPEKSFLCFISSCQNESFEITDSNVFSLHQLSIKYEVPCLMDLTNEYIKEHNKSLVFQSIQYKVQLQKNSDDNSISISLENDEEAIVSDFFNYIKSEKLAELPVPMLYRIINNPKLDINKIEKEKANQMIEFLLKCLKKHKKEASVLFLNLDLENQRIELFSKLINEYSDIFDFSMINHKFLMKTTTDLLSELSIIKRDFSNSIEKANILFEQIKKEKQEQQNTFNSFKQYLQDQMDKNRKELQESYQDFKKQMGNENRIQLDSLNSLKQSVQNQMNKEHEKIEISLQSFKQQIVKENKAIKDEAILNVNELKKLVNQNNKRINSCITKDVQNITF